MENCAPFRSIVAMNGANPAGPRSLVPVPSCTTAEIGFDVGLLVASTLPGSWLTSATSLVRALCRHRIRNRPCRRRLHHRRHPRSGHLHRSHHIAARPLQPDPCSLSFAPMNIDNQPVRIRQQKRRVLRHIVHIQHHPRHIVRVLRRPNLLQKSVVRHRKALAHQLLRQLRPCRSK
jgi:hypothetical protein